MSGPDGDQDGTPTDVGDGSHPVEPDEPDLPGEDNPGERLISKYDPTIDAEGERKEDHVPSEEEVDVPQETARLFWYLVAVFNVAIMALAVGIMLIAFQERWTVGGQVTIVGVVLLSYGYYRYRKHARSESNDGNG